MWANGGAVLEENCPAGYYNLDGTGACLQAEAGKVTTTTDPASTTTALAAVTTGGLAGQASTTPARYQTPCSQGYYKASAGAGDCVDVPNGSRGENGSGAYASSGAVIAVSCVAGKFSADGSGDCSSCVDGS